MKVLFRADGNIRIGLGHVYRCLALATVIEKSFECIFAIANPDSTVKSLVTNAGFKIVTLDEVSYKLPNDMNQTFEIPFDLDNHLNEISIVVLDGYWFGTSYQKAIKKKGKKLVCIDDLANWEYYADVIINHAPDFDISKYNSQSYTRIYGGLKYLMIRPNFYTKPINKSPNKRTLISIGGIDHYEFTFKMAVIIAKLFESPEITMVVSSNFSEEHLHKLIDLEENYAGIEILKDLDGNAMVTTMDRCEYAILSASTILMEAYTRGIYAAVGHYSNNQLHTYQAMTNNNWAFGIGDLLTSSNESLKLKLSEYFFSKHDIAPRQITNPGEILTAIFTELCLN